MASALGLPRAASSSQRNVVRPFPLSAVRLSPSPWLQAVEANLAYLHRLEPDRLLHGYVVDFIQVHWRSWYFPSFNVADSAITVGAGLLILDELRRVRRAR